MKKISFFVLPVIMLLLSSCLGTYDSVSVSVDVEKNGTTFDYDNSTCIVGDTINFTINVSSLDDGETDNTIDYVYLQYSYNGNAKTDYLIENNVNSTIPLSEEASFVIPEIPTDGVIHIICQVGTLDKGVDNKSYHEIDIDLDVVAAE